MSDGLKTVRVLFAATVRSGTTRPAGAVPETLCIYEEQQRARQQVLGRVLGRLGGHRLAPAFYSYLLCGQTWQELQTVHGIKANTLSRAFWRALAPAVDECRRRFAEETSHG